MRWDIVSRAECMPDGVYERKKRQSIVHHGTELVPNAQSRKMNIPVRLSVREVYSNPQRNEGPFAGKHM